MKRYDLENESRMGGWSTENVMNENETGEWVRYEDVADLQRQLAAVTEERDQLQKALVLADALRNKGFTAAQVSTVQTADGPVVVWERNK